MMRHMFVCFHATGCLDFHLDQYLPIHLSNGESKRRTFFIPVSAVTGWRHRLSIENIAEVNFGCGTFEFAAQLVTDCNKFVSHGCTPFLDYCHIHLTSACATIRDVKKAGRLTPEFSSSAIHHQLQTKKKIKIKMEACVWLCKNTVAFHLPQARGNSHRWALHRKEKKKKTTQLMRYIIERNQKLPVTKNCRSEQGTKGRSPRKTQ